MSVFRKRRSGSPFGLLCAAVSILALVLGYPNKGCSLERESPQGASDPRDDLSPWGVASGAEWFSAYPAFNPMLKEAGVRWLRGFYEWQTIQPKKGSWDFSLPDQLMNNARSNNLHLIGVFAYFAPWASSDGGTRKFPIKDLQFWRDYVSGLVGRYHGDIKYWEVWNEFNGSFAQGGTPAIYAELVREAWLAAKKIDPSAKIGMSVANFDINFLDAAIKAGAANHFDYVCVHPYEILGQLSDRGEPAFLNMAMTLRKLLRTNNQREDIPLWITEIGSAAPVKPGESADAMQAVMLAKAYLLSIASGFQRVFWFEARGPAYGKEMDLGLIRPDMTMRPSYHALRTLTGTLGPEPRPIGWLELGDGGYGFLFDTGKRTVLAAWSPAKHTVSTQFDSEVHLISLGGDERRLQAKEPITLTEAPVLITGLPQSLVDLARAQAAKPYPWGGQHSGTAIASVALRAANVENGISQLAPGTTVAEADWRRTDFSVPDSEGHYVYFRVDPTFASFDTSDVEITAVVRRTRPDKVAGLTIDYESTKGYVGSDYRAIGDSGSWEEVTWHLHDARFVGAWGWNFRLNAISSPNEFLIREVRIKKAK